LRALPVSPYCNDLDHDGYSQLQGDFNDNNATVYPNAPEIVDGLDNDLNGAVDEVLVSQSSSFTNNFSSPLLVPWPVRITGTLTSNTGSNAGSAHFFKIDVTTTVDLRFQLKNTGNFNGYIQVYNLDGSGYSSEYVSGLSQPSDLTVTFTPGEWHFSVIFGVSGGLGNYELVVAKALPRVDPLLFAGAPIAQSGGQIRLSVPQVSQQLASRSTEVRFWVSGYGWVGSSTVPGSGSSFLDWVPSAGADLSKLRYSIQYFKDDLRSSASSPAVPLLTSTCTFGIQPATLLVPAGGGSAKLSVTTGDGCSWQVSADSSWISLDGPASSNNGTGPPLGWESGSGSASVYIDANTTSLARTATLTIAGQTIAVSQPAPAIGLSVPQVLFSWKPGSPAPAAQAVTLSNGGAGALVWNATASLPWIVVSPHSGTVASTVAFAVSVDTSATQVQVPGTYSGNVTITAGGSVSSVFVILTVLPQGSTPCTFALSAGGQAFPVPGGTGSVNVTTASGCSWTASNTLSWVTIIGGASGTGNGAVTYQVAVNTGGARSGSLNLAGLPFAVEQASATVTGLNAVGSMAQMASGGLWNTTITLVNNSSATATARLNFFDDNGRPFLLPLTFPQTSSAAPLLAFTLDRSLAPGAALVVQTAGQTSQATLSGWTQLLANGNISGFAVFAWNTGGGQQEAVVPLENRNPGSFVLWFDNTGGYTTGVALANVAAQAASVGVIIRDDTGGLLSSSAKTVPAQGHTQFMATDLSALTAGRRGTVEFQTPTGGQISVLGIRASPTSAITSTPAIAK
jgi:hypothetical protein